MMTTTVECFSANNRTLEELGKLIERRSKVLNQTAEQACIAVAITVMKSLRAGTAKSKGSVKSIVTQIEGDLQIAVAECSDICVSFKTTSGVRKPCLRRGGRSGPIVQDKRIWWRVPIDKAITRAKVYKVTLSGDRVRAWKKQPPEEYVVARDIEYAKKITIERYSKIVKRYTGLGKDAWSRAMMLASDRPANFIAGDKAKGILNSTVTVLKDMSKGDLIGSRGTYSITVEDNLNYAAAALRGGEGYVNTAMMKAANAVNGMLNHYIEAHQGNGDWFGEQFLPSAPFPPEAFGD